MNRSISSLSVCAILILTSLITPFSVSSESEPVVYGWWSDYSRDKEMDGVSDILEWKLKQGYRFFNPDLARVFVR